MATEFVSQPQSCIFVASIRSENVLSPGLHCPLAHHLIIGASIIILSTFTIDLCCFLVFYDPVVSIERESFEFH